MADEDDEEDEEVDGIIPAVTDAVVVLSTPLMMHLAQTTEPMGNGPMLPAAERFAFTSIVTVRALVLLLTMRSPL
jgi:hypothetical protein